MAPPEPPVEFDGSARLGPLSSPCDDVSSLNGAPRRSYRGEVISSAGPRMAAGNAPATETGAKSLQVSLLVLFLIAIIMRFTPQQKLSAAGREGGLYLMSAIPSGPVRICEYRLANECENQVKTIP